MLRARSAALLSALPVALVTAHSAGCISPPFVPSASDDGSSIDLRDGAPPLIVGSSGGDMGSDSATSADVAACHARGGPADASCVIADGLGIFVAPAASGGDDTSGDGTRERPFATIEFALAHLGGQSRVYVCNAAYAESVTMTSPGASLFGGLACPGSDAGPAWTYVGGQATVTAPQGSYALHLVDLASAIEIDDVAFVSADATGTDSAGNGASSIAAFVQGSSATFVRVSLTAGTGSNGSDASTATPGANYAGAVAASGSPGFAPWDAGVDANGAGGGGGAGGASACLLFGTSAGGTGGSAATAQIPGGDGGMGIQILPADAAPAYAPAPGSHPVGLGGAGALSGCYSGEDGADGAPGPGGNPGSSFGVLTASGWTPASGGDGQPGGPGQGGGGGGGRGVPSSGGDGGGAGGCGGAGGAGGHGGGASIALAAVGSSLTLSGCTLTTGDGGNGGNGASGQPGQAGGASRDLEAGACIGGMGGNGAGGSGGAGGPQGMSVGVLFARASATLTTDRSTRFLQGAAGKPGDGGAGGTHGGTGTNGFDGQSGQRGFNDPLGASAAEGL